MAAIDERVDRLTRDLQRYKRFHAPAKEGDLARLQEDLPLLELQLEQVSERKEQVDRALAPLLQELIRLRAEGRSLTSAQAIAEGFDRELQFAVNTYEKRSIHERCAQRFSGRSSPRVVLAELRRQRAGIQRNIDKLDKRLAQTAARAAGDVRAVVVDGNNLCYEAGDYFGLVALKPLCEALVKRCALTVVFDASILHLTGLSQEQLRTSLRGVKVHVVTSKTSADEAILDAARDPYCFVVSNDRYGEFREKDAVQNERVLGHNILNGHVTVYDLGVDVPFEGP